MLRALHHRGPDGWGVYCDPARRAMLLHARLAIVDLETGTQPLGNEDQSVWAVVVLVTWEPLHLLYQQLHTRRFAAEPQLRMAEQPAKRSDSYNLV